MFKLLAITLSTVAATSWTPTSRPLHPTKDTIGITFALKLQNAHKLENHLLTLADPTSSSYGQYLTIDEINTMYPTSNPNAAITIQQWIQSTTKDTIVIDTSAHGFITATLPIQVATQLFQEEFIEYQFNDRKVIRSKHMNPTQRLYPNEINHLIDFISGYDYFPIN